MNLSEKSLIEAAQEAIGDGEQVLAAGVFHPRGTSGASQAGLLAGGALGFIPGVGKGVGEALQAAAEGGGYAARHGLAHKDGVPVNTLVAVTAQRLVAWQAEHDQVLGFKVKAPFATWDRDRIAVTIHARAKVRTFEVEDLETGNKYEMETPRFSRMHGSVVIKLLEHGEATAPDG